MPILRITGGGRRELSLEPRDRPASAEELRQWLRMVSLAVERAFVDRSAATVTVAPQPWSFGRTIPDSRTVRVGDTSYLVGRIGRCSAEFLTELSESEDFRRGLLWLTGPAPIDDRQLPGLAAAVEAESPVIDGGEEILLRTDDGLRLLWLNPGRQTAPIVNALERLAGSLKWDVKITREWPSD